MIRKNKNNLKQYQWLAGLIDGSGCFLISNKEYASLEITAPLVDEALVYQIKILFGGSIKASSSLKALRYRLHNKEGLTKLLHAINGNVRNSIRQQQFKRVLNLYNIKFIEPCVFTWDSGYASGLLDSDGRVSLSVKKHTDLNNPEQKGTLGKIQRLQHVLAMQLNIKITQKYKKNLDFLTKAFNPLNSDKPFGRIVFDKSQNSYYSWTISDKTEVGIFLYYISKYPCYSKKAHRLRLLQMFYELYEQKAYLVQEGTYLKHRWNCFANNWFRYDR
jgi:ubiquinol-cytochrome c reductase cytochrome b subunit